MVVETGPAIPDRVAIVVGGGAAGDGIGNGRAAAILLARGGARVVVADRQIDLAERTVALIEAEGGQAIAVAADVTDEQACETLVSAAVARYGGVDMLVNNVGMSRMATVADETLESWEALFRVNLTSMVLVSKYAIRAMEQRGSGAIVNIGSISALRPRGLTAYAASKGAVIALTRAMAVDHGPQGIRVNCVAPGAVYTPMVAEAGLSDDARAARIKSSALGLEGTGWDVGHAVAFLLSDLARYITGQTLVVDGGATLLGRPRS